MGVSRITSVLPTGHVICNMQFNCQLGGTAGGYLQLGKVNEYTEVQHTCNSQVLVSYSIYYTYIHTYLHTLYLMLSSYTQKANVYP